MRSYPTSNKHQQIQYFTNKIFRLRSKNIYEEKIGCETNKMYTVKQFIKFYLFFMYFVYFYISSNLFSLRRLNWLFSQVDIKMVISQIFTWFLQKEAWLFLSQFPFWNTILFANVFLLIYLINWHNFKIGSCIARMTKEKRSDVVSDATTLFVYNHMNQTTSEKHIQL